MKIAARIVLGVFAIAVATLIVIACIRNPILGVAMVIVIGGVTMLAWLMLTAFPDDSMKGEPSEAAVEAVARAIRAQLPSGAQFGPSLNALDAIGLCVVEGYETEPGD